MYSGTPGELVARLSQHVVTHRRGGAGRKQNAAAAATSGRTYGDAGDTKFLFFLYGAKARSDTGGVAQQRVGLPPPDGSPKAFSFSPIFLFHARKRKMGCGRRIGAIGVRGGARFSVRKTGIPTLNPIGWIGLQGRCELSDRKSTRLNSSHSGQSRMPSSA